MAKTAKAASGAIGKVAIIYGEVKAIAPDGTVRILGPNSLVFADDQIITGADGSVSLILDGTPPIHLDLGRMSQITLDEDVYGGPASAADAAAQAEQAQQAILAGEQPIEPEAPAAGGEASSGGGHPVVNNSLTGAEVTPDSGAETRGIGFAPLENVEYDSVPIGGDDIGAVDDEGINECWIRGNLGGPDDDSDHPTPDAFIVGKLSYNFGADGPHPTEPFAWSMVGLEDMNIKSHGHELLYEVVDGGQTLNAYYVIQCGSPNGGEQTIIDGPSIAVAEKVSFEPMEFRVDVFSLELTNIDTGAYKFTLFKPLDHPVADTEDDINYIFRYEMKDGDNSTGSGVLRMTVDDDSPIVKECRYENRTVDEDDINMTCQSVGNDPNDGAWYDGSFTGNPWYGHDHGPANIWGSLAGLVRFGADGPADNPDTWWPNDGGFSFSEDLSSLPEGLTSKGAAISYWVDPETDTLYGYVACMQKTSEGSGDGNPLDGARVVFTLELEGNGDYKFSLYDQLDHLKPEGEDRSSYNCDGPDTTIPIDFSGVIVATDYDGDSVTLAKGKFVINITDDEPKEADSCPEVGIVEEEMLSGGNPEKYDSSPDTLVATGWLNSQVSVGADEPVTFSLSGFTCGLPQLTSHGEDISYKVDGNTLLAYIEGDKDGNPPVEQRDIFTLNVQSNGYYTFTLKDQLDHDGCGEDALCIDFSSMIVATDFDGDSITLNGNDLIIKIIDDMPVANDITVVLDDDDVIGANGNKGGSYDDDGPVNAIATGTLDFGYGADGPGYVDFAAMNGKTAMVGIEEVTYQWDAGNNTLTAKIASSTDPDRVGNDLFKVEVTNPTTGDYKVTLVDNVLHAPPEITVNTDNYPEIENLVKIKVGLTYGDLDDAFWWYTSLKETADGFGIQSTVDSNAPDEINYLEPSGGLKSEVMIFELQGDLSATHATVDITAFYSPEGGVGSERGVYALYKDGVEVQGPTTFTADSNSGNYTLNITCLEGFDEIRFGAVRGTSDPSGGDSSDYYIKEIKFTNVPENNTLVDLTYTATDYDGDHDHGTLTLNLDDDTPIAVNDCKSTTAGDPIPKTYNLLLILDTSGSIDPSELAKEVQAMKDLLDKYADIAKDGAAGVKVQIVSFASTATLYHSEPVDIATAQAQLDSLNYDGEMTDYDAALAQATAAINNSYDGAGWPNATGTLENIVYFVSDGEPTEGDDTEGIDNGEESAWEATLANVGATAWAVGVGAGVGDEDLEDVAYPDSNVVNVNNFDDLLDGLIGTIAPQTASGNVMTNDLPGADGAEVTAVSYIDVDGNPATAIVDDDGVTVETLLGELTIKSNGEYSYEANTDELFDQKVTVDVSNTNLGTGMGAGNMVKVSAVGDGATSLIDNDGAFGVASDDGGNGERFDEINYLGGGKSEAMIFELQDGKVAESALVNITEFFSDETGVGNEVGSYELFLNGEKVQDATVFTATSKSGNLELLIDGPECGFDEVRFFAKEGTNASGGSDNSDYSIGSITFDLYQQDVFHYEITDGDGDKSCADLTINIDIDNLIDDQNPEV